MIITPNYCTLKNNPCHYANGNGECMATECYDTGVMVYPQVEGITPTVVEIETAIGETELLESLK